MGIVDEEGSNLYCEACDELLVDCICDEEEFDEEDEDEDEE